MSIIVNIADVYHRCLYLLFQQREEKQLDTSLEALTQQVVELKSSITALLYKLEHEHATLNW